jgi:hypothetical protein
MLILLTGSSLVTMLMASMWRSSTMRHSPAATEKLLTPSERSKGILGTLMRYLALVVGVVVWVLGKQRML